MADQSEIDAINAALAEYGFPPIRRLYKRINVYAKLPGRRELYLDATCAARNLREARELLAIYHPSHTYAASDLIARYA